MKLNFTVDLEDEGADGVSVAVYGDEADGLLFARSGIEGIPQAIEYLKQNLEGMIQDAASDYSSR